MEEKQAMNMLRNHGGGAGCPFGLIAMMLLSVSVHAQTPQMPPDIDPGPPPTYIPPPLDSAVIPPFNAADPLSGELTYGQHINLRVISSLPEGAQFQWYKDGEPLAGEASSTLSIDRVSKADAGVYRVEVIVDGLVTSTAETAFSVFSQASLANISTRADAQSGENILISGFVIEGSGSKTLLVRAVGPTIGAAPYNVAGALEIPVMTIFRDDIKLREYADWPSFVDQAALADATSATGAFPLKDGSADSAAVVGLSAGNYTVHVEGSGGRTGVVLVELFDATDVDNDAELVNISSRAVVGSGDAVLIPGVVVEGLTPKRALIRAVGPSLGSQGVSGFLADPQLAIMSEGVELDSNDNWGDFPDQTNLAAATTASGAFPLEPGGKDAAGVYLLDPGAYTVVVTGVGGATGITLVEIYGLDD